MASSVKTLKQQRQMLEHQLCVTRMNLEIVARKLSRVDEFRQYTKYHKLLNQIAVLQADIGRWRHKIEQFDIENAGDVDA